MEPPAPLQSPVPHLLASYSVASDQEKEIIRSFIETLEHRRWEIDQEIEVLVKVRQEEKAAIDAVIRQHDAIMLPLRGLAPEILSEIFSHCQRGSAAEIVPEISNSFHSLERPIVLTHVCRRWRTVVVASSGWWTTLRVKLGFPFRSHSQRHSHLALTKLRISRSGISPLEICLQISDSIQTAHIKKKKVPFSWHCQGAQIDGDLYTSYPFCNTTS